MPVAEADPFADLGASDLIGGEYGAPAFQQDASGNLSEVPKAQLNSLPAPDVGDMFSDLIPQHAAESREDLGMFDDLVPEPETETEKALAETPQAFLDSTPGSEKPLFDDQDMTISEALNYARDTINKISPGFLNQLTSSPLKATHLTPNPKDTRLKAFGKAAVNQGMALVEGMTSPLMLATMAAGTLPALARPIVAGFLADTVRHIPEAYEQAEFARKNYPAGSQETIEAGLNLAGLLTFSHLLSRHVTKMPVKPASASQPAPALQSKTAAPTTGAPPPAPAPAAPEARPEQRMVPIEELPKTEPSADPIGVTETIAELERRNAPSTEPVIPKEPAGTKFDIPENVRRDPQVDAVINESVDPKLVEEMPVGDTKTAEQLTAEKATADAELQAMQEKQDIRVGAAKPLRAGEDVRPEADMFQAEAQPDIFDQPRKPRQSAPDGGFAEHPLIQFIQGDMGGIMSKSTARRKLGERFTENQSLWEDAPHFTDPRQNKVYDARSGQTPDAVATEAAKAGLLPEGADASTLWAELDKIARSSQRTKQGEWQQNREAKAGEKAAKNEVEPGMDPANPNWPDWSVPVEKQAAKIKLKAKKEGGFVNPEILKEVADFGKRLYERGITFKEWAGEMVRNLGRKVSGQLKAIWDSISGADFLPNSTQGGSIFSGGGKVKAKGVTPRGDTEFLHIPSGPKRTFKGLEREGAADILGRTKNKVGKLLSKATDKHVDVEQELFGAMSSDMTRPAKGLSSKAVDKAYDEIPAYLAAKENGRPLPTLSKTAQDLMGGWENIAEKTGQIMAANGVQVFDPALNAYRPSHLQGRKLVPRMFKQEVEQVMKDRNKDAPLWNNLVSDLQKQRGITEAEATKILQSEAGRFSSSGFMGAIDMARTSKMPESFYEYDLRNIASRYIPAFSERMAQIIAFGQRLGPKDAPIKPNLWDVARKETADVHTQEILNTMEDMSVNLKPKNFGGRFMSGAQTTATGLYLTSPTTTIRNLISGLIATPELLGVRRSVQGLARIIRNRQAFADAREVGVIRDSIGTVLHADKLGDSFVHDVIRTGTDKALKYSLHSGSESFVRTHGFISADIFAKDAVKALNKRPTSMRSKEALGLFKRMGVDAAKIVAEKGDWRTGPETRKFIRTFVRETQGGYRYNQVPLWANSNNGRFLYQFGRWGTMKSRNIARNAIRPAFGETVQWHGKTMTRVDFRPLIKMALTPVILGETFAGIAQLMFGRDRRDASVSEIVAAFNEDEKKGLLMALERVANDVIMAGTLGIWGQPLDWAKSLRGQSRFKNPAEPPGLGSIKALRDLGMKFLDQAGQITRKDILAFANSFVPGAKQARDMYRNFMDEPLYEAENDVQTLRSAARRWADQAGMDVSPRSKGDFRKSPMAPEYEPIKEALLVGDVQRASFLKKTFLDKQPNRGLAAKNLKASIQMSQPFRAGPFTAKVHRDNFMEWAKKNLSADDLNQAQRIQERYKKAAIAAELW